MKIKYRGTHTPTVAHTHTPTVTHTHDGSWFRPICIYIKQYIIQQYER